jgi:type IV secretion system protein VirB10
MTTINEPIAQEEAPPVDINSIGPRTRQFPLKSAIFITLVILLVAAAAVVGLKYVGKKAAESIAPARAPAVVQAPPRGKAILELEQEAVTATAAQPEGTAEKRTAATTPASINQASPTCIEGVLLDKNRRPIKDADGNTVNCAISKPQAVPAVDKAAAPRNQIGPVGAAPTERSMSRYAGDTRLHIPTSSENKLVGALPAIPGLPVPTDSSRAITESLQRLTSLAQGGAAPGATANLSGAASSVPVQAANAQGPIGNQLRGSNPTRVLASRSLDENLIIPRSTQIDCSLTMRIVTEVSGFATCMISQPVYSANGRVLLIERFSQVDGEFVAAGQPGQRRVAVIWNRVRKPGGVTIDIDSPASDSLGTAGLEGYVDNRWMERIGNAYLLSFFKDALTYEVANRPSSGATTQAGANVLQNTTQTSNALAEKLLSAGLAIKPTTYAFQGDRVAIFVARDIDFSPVYAVQSVKP